MAADQKRKRERERLLALSFCRADLLFELNIDRKVEYVAGATDVMLGKSSSDLLGHSFLNIVHSDDQQLTTQLLDSAKDRGRLDDASLSLGGIKASKIPVILSGYRVPEFNNHFFLALKVDTKRAAAAKEEKLQKDEESGLLEVASFAQSAAQRVTSFISAGGDAQVSLVKLNQLDGLLTKVGATDKKKLLGAIGDVLNSNSIGGDTASRIDTESFSFVHTHDVDPNDINDQLEKLAGNILPDGDKVQAISTTLDVDGAGLNEEQVTKALIYTMQTFCENESSLKQNSMSDILSTLMTNTVENVGYIKDIIRKRDLDIHFMPIFHLKGGYVHHFEGLLRLTGDRSNESPFNYVRLAEEVNIICDLDMSVIKKTIDYIYSFQKKGFIPPIAVNLSGLSLSNKTFMDQLHMILRNSPDIAGQLMFEITESAKIDDLPMVNNLLQNIRKMGFEVCLDDFGSGAASFDYINALDVDGVKFDGPVVKRAYATEKGHDLLRAMATMCNGLNIHTIAEMIEDKDMADHMMKSGIDFAQGWYFGKAVPDPLQFKNQFDHSKR
ncbi:EAL domain-containing protein [Terasakiella sp. A23]|uniref:EAL domain-containing protein n=1 Tax=Terasakiella sp. FCG-A23 TaxID=3080561 RepID=UPI002952C43E|nr:EAL domain-containing protein [Terasakiella sp. A23]MDV7339444.1 EAL domain-containing protein [Terasakiella sp. A23]